MPPRSIQFQTGGIYHLYNRGNNGKTIFPDHDHFVSCERLMRRYAKQQDILLLAYVLMPNHYHFLVQQQGATPVSRWLYTIFKSYTQHVNTNDSYSGTLFEGRFHARQVINEQYLVRAALYIHSNPVKDGFVEHPEDWHYSNYRDWGGENPVSVCRHFFRSGEDYRQTMQRYLEIVRDQSTAC
ncbi:MAG: transposase [Anaerolineae bacterium]|nr:transposase [Anaerolineae bacterium]